MTKTIAFILAVAIFALFALPVTAATANQSTPGEATPDYDLNILDDSISWLYVLIAVVSVLLVILAAVVVAKRIK